MTFKLPYIEYNLPLRYRDEFVSRRIPWGEAENLVKEGDVVLYQANAETYHAVELLWFFEYDSTPGWRRARVRHVEWNYEWSVDPDELFAFAEEREVERRKKADINTLFTRSLDENVEGNFFEQEVKSFFSMYDKITDAQAQLASQALKMLYVSLSDEDQKKFAYVWEHEYFLPYKNLNGAELKPGFSPSQVTPKFGKTKL